MQIQGGLVKMRYADRVAAVSPGQTFSCPRIKSLYDCGRAVDVRSGFTATGRPNITAAVTAQQGEGQLCKQLPPSASARPQDILWEGSQHVQHVGVEEVEALYVSLSQRANEQNVLLVLYAPWCQHCQNVVPEVEKLAAGLSHEPSLSVVALCTKAPAARYFSTDVLGINALPSFVLFPKGSRTFFKYKGRAHDAQSLLKFLNMVCNQLQDSVWQLQGVVTATTSTTAIRPPATTPLPATNLLTPLPAILIGMVGIAVLFHKLTNRSTAASTPEQEQQGEDLAGGIITPKRLLKQIDQVMSRMGSLMWKLAGARVSVSIMASQVAALERQTAIRSSTEALGDAPKAIPADSEVGGETLADGGVDATAGITTTALAVGGASEPPITQGTVGCNSSESQQTVTDVELVSQLQGEQTECTTVAAVVSPAAALLTTPQPLVQNASQQPAVDTANNILPYNAGSTISSAEVLKLLDEEGDVDKVVEKLLAKNITLQDLPTKIDSQPAKL